MSRSFLSLRRALLGAAFAGSLGFGATQAFAEPNAGSAAAMRICGPGQRACYCPEGTYCMSLMFRCPC